MAGLLEEKDWQQLAFNIHQDLKMAVPCFLFLTSLRQSAGVTAALQIKDIISSAVVAMCSVKNEPCHWITTLLEEQRSSPLWPGGNHTEQVAH